MITTRTARGAATSASAAFAVAASVVAAAALVVPGLAAAGEARSASPALTVELGAAWQRRNTAQVPNAAPNTRFDVDRLTGEGPFATGRVVLDWPLAERHRVRLTAAPLRVDESGTTATPIVFQDTTFAAGPIRARYVFDSWRAGWRYTFHDSPRWTWAAGATLKVRDAELRLAQGAVTRSRDDRGLVPLLALEGTWRFAPRWHATLDAEGLAAPQGRAFDVALKLGVDVTDRLSVAGGYRLLDGGADNDDLYTFARFDYAVLGATWRF